MSKEEMLIVQKKQLREDIYVLLFGIFNIFYRPLCNFIFCTDINRSGSFVKDLYDFLLYAGIGTTIFGVCCIIYHKHKYSKEVKES